jgi:hypothetical protein
MSRPQTCKITKLDTILTSLPQCKKRLSEVEFGVLSEQELVA